MQFQTSKFLAVVFFLLSLAFCVHAQLPDASTPDGRSGVNKEDLPDSIKETFAKQRIKAEEKDFNEMLGQSEEVSKISDDLFKSYETNQKLMPDDAKKIERLGKLVKKIRDELGTESDDDKDKTNDSPLSFNDALKGIRETSSNLFSELKKQGRFSISVVAVESSNTLLKLVRFVRRTPN